MALKLGVVASRDGGGVKTTAHMSWRRAARPHFTGTRDCGDEMTCYPTTHSHPHCADYREVSKSPAHLNDSTM